MRAELRFSLYPAPRLGSRANLGFQIGERGRRIAALLLAACGCGEGFQSLALQGVQFACSLGCQIETCDEFHRFLLEFGGPTIGAFLAPPTDGHRGKALMVVGVDK